MIPLTKNVRFSNVQAKGLNCETVVAITAMWEISLNTMIFITYNKPTRCNSGSVVFINNYRYALHVSDALCVYHQERYKL